MNSQHRPTKHRNIQAPVERWLPSKLMALRIRCNLSQAQLSRLCGVTPGAIGQLEAGHRRPSRHMGGTLNLVRRLHKVSREEIESKIAQFPFLKRRDGRVLEVEGWGDKPPKTGV